MNNIIDLEILAAKLAHCGYVRVFPALNIVQFKPDILSEWKFMFADFNKPITIDSAYYDSKKQIITITDFCGDLFTIIPSGVVCALTRLVYAIKNPHSLIMSRGKREPIDITEAKYFIRVNGALIYCDIDFNIIYKDSARHKTIVNIEKVEKTLSCNILNGYIVAPADYIIDGNAVLVDGVRHYLVYSRGQPALYDGTNKIFLPTVLELQIRDLNESGIYGNVQMPDMQPYQSWFIYKFAYIGRTKTGKFVELAPINIKPALHTKMPCSC